MRSRTSFYSLYKSKKSMLCFVDDMVYMGVKLQVLIKYHTKEPHSWGIEYFRVIDAISVNGQCFL